MKMGQKPTHIQQIPRSKPVSYLDQGMVNNLTINPYIYIYIYNRSLWNFHNFPRHQNIKKKKKTFLKPGIIKKKKKKTHTHTPKNFN